MALAAIAVVPTATGWLRGLWWYYRRYTDTTIHTAATATLAIFGILVFVDPWFAALAIGSYVVPPVILYALDVEPPVEGGHEPPLEDGLESDRREHGSAATTRRERSTATEVVQESTRSSGGDGDTDSDTDDGDTDTDSDDGDTDSDSDDGDTDSDNDG